MFSTDKQTAERNSAIELLRIFAGMAIIILHFNFFNLHVAEIATGVTQKTLLLLEALCACAVNVFILISGYCSANHRKINSSRLLKVVIQTSAFRFSFALLTCMMNNSWPIVKLLGALLPVNYYIILYVALMCIAPYLNLLIDKLSKDNMHRFIYILMVVLSIYPTAVDALEEALGKSLMGLNSISIRGSMAGYTIINFMLVYIIGVYIRKAELLSKYKMETLCIMIGCSVLGIYLWHEVLPKTAYSYSNPCVILEACLIFMMFGKMNFKNKTINLIAPASLTCFLIHGYFLDAIKNSMNIEDEFVFVMTLLIGCVIGIYAVSILVMKIWNIIYGVVFSKVVNKIPIIDIKEG